MLRLWMCVFGFIGLIWGVTRWAEGLRKSNEQVIAAAAVHMTRLCTALCCQMLWTFSVCRFTHLLSFASPDES